jgi:hypothetical protein
VRRSALLLFAALLAVNATLLVAQPGQALPLSLGAYFFGPKLVRAEVIVQEADGLRDYRVDRGVVRSNRGGSLVLRERDGTVVVIPVARDADVTVHGRASRLGAVRIGMTATTVREGSSPAETVRAGR